MNPDPISKPPSPPLQPYDLRAEGARARKLSNDVAGVKTLVEGVRLVNDTVLAQVLFALWDSGFYEYSLAHPTFQVQAAADELHLDATLLKWLLDYLIGRGIMQKTDAAIGLTEHGIRLSNILLQGTMNLYIGGWGPQLANIGPLLRKEMPLTDFRNLRSGRHTVKGTEQLICVRTVPAVLKILARKNLKGVLHLACRTGQFLIELARTDPTLHGIGVDKDASRITSAHANAAAYDVASRLTFVAAEVGNERLPLIDDAIKSVDVITALYLLHEVARHGRQTVLDMLRQIKATFPGRQFLFMETLPYDGPPPGAKPPSTFSQLDYLLIHRIRGQGLPLPADEWKSMIEEAGLKLLEFHEVFWSGLYLAEL